MREEHGRCRSVDTMSRRDFIRNTGMGPLTVMALDAGSRFSRGATTAGTSPIAFNTANLVARVTNYRFELRNWMDQHQKTVAATDAAAWRAICHEIAGAGFKAVEIWEAHASPETLDQTKALQWKEILQQSGLKPVAYAGKLSRKTVQICRWLEIPHIDGGLGDMTPEQATVLCKDSGVRFNIENHPEKSPAEILEKIGGGNEWLGVCIDTGWLGTQGVSAPGVIKACGPLVRHVHVKDVKEAGEHQTCLLGAGVVNVAECLKTLRALKYTGWYSWEDEPEDRNPFDSAKRNLEWIKQHLSA